MPISKELLEYQKVDEQLRKIEQEMSASEERKKYMQAKKFMETARERLEAQDRHAVELRAMRDDLIVRAEETTKAIAEYNDLDEILEESGGDLSFYKKNAQALLEKLRSIKGDLNRLIAEITAASEEYEKFKKQTIAMQKQYKEYSEKFKELKNSRAEDVSRITAKLSELSAKIAPDIMERYQAKRKERIFPIVVPLNNWMCVCGMELPLLHQSELAGGNMIECEHCRRIIYKP